MSILFVAQSLPYPAHGTGDGLIAHHVVKALAARHDVRLVSFGERGDERALAFEEESGVAVELTPRARAALLTYYLTPRGLPYAAHRAATRGLRQRLESADADPSVDLVVLHGHALAGYLPAITRTPVVLHAIDAASAWYERLGRASGDPLRRIHRRHETERVRRFERIVYPLARAVVVVSDDDRRALLASTPESRVVVIPNGVDAAYFHPSVEPTEPESLIFTGNLHYAPNADAVAGFHRDVWPRLVADRPGLTWTIAGRFPPPGVRAIARSDSRVRVTGEVADLRPHVWRAAVYVSPMRVGTGIKNKVLEAMACGKAIVATAQSLNGIPAVDGEHVLVARTADEFRQAIVRLLDDAALRAALGGRARALAETLSWAGVTRAYEDLYEEIVHGSAPSLTSSGASRS